MKDTLKIALIQTALHWEDPEANRLAFEKKLNTLESEDLDVIILPEMFTSGFTMHPERVAEAMNGDTAQWLKNMSKTTNAAITGSLVVEENGNYFNRLLFVEPSGETSYYDKKHTFSLAGEDKVYEAGNEKVIITYKGWQLCPMICYDLRFPVWSRNVEDYDVLFYVANWPEKRVAAWDALLKARAIENMAYCIGVNRVGLDGNNHPYVGHSAVYDVLGDPVVEPTDRDGICITSLNKNHIETLRGKLKFLQDRDSFSLKV